jgi:putative chitinase
VSVTDYYAFGSEVRERTYEKLSYEYGFNGQIEDNEITGNNGSHLAFEYRIYDSRLGKFLSVDPLLTSYPWNSTYAFAENRVIDGVDLEGMEYISINNANIDLIEPDGRGYTVSINGSTYCASGIVSYNNEQYLNLGQHVSVDGEQISSFFVTKDQLQSIFPNANTASINSLYTTLNNSMMNYSINNHISLAHFLSQAGHETGGFAQGLGIEENLNYSVSGLVGTFGRYFYTGEKVNGKYNADLYGRKQGQIADQEGIANIVYANRMGNGSIESGDGYNYRGRGIFQLTGRDNYTAFNTFLNEKGVDLVSNPSLLSSSNDYAIKSALWFYKVNVINRININKATVKTVSAYVNNGGNENKTINGLSDRENYYKRAIDKLR